MVRRRGTIDDVFQFVKNRVSTRDAAERYGITVNRSGFARCPFHDEDTPSLKLYPGAGGFHCFGCHKGGSVIDFTAQLFGLDPLGAVRKLNEDFQLGLPIDQRPTAKERAEAHRRKELAATRRAFEEWRQETVNRLNSCIRIANRAAPTGWDDLTDQQILAIRWRDTLEAYADSLTSGSIDEQMEIFRFRKEMIDVCNQILSSTPQKSSAA